MLAEMLLSEARDPGGEMVDAPFSARGLPKERGYRWNGDRKVWWSEVADEAVTGESEFGRDFIYGGKRAPETKRVTWRARYSLQ